MKHFFESGNNERTLLLLHGTGGTERDLIPLAERIDPDAAKLGVRGNVNENGMARFFRRIAEGVFDEEDLVKRTQELHTFVSDEAVEYGFDRDKVVAVGYSNGANIAASLLFHYEKPLAGAALFHPMVPRRGIDLPNLSGLPVFISAGKHDPICPKEETEELAQLLREAGAKVEVFWQDGGHQLMPSEVAAAAEWYEKHIG